MDDQADERRQPGYESSEGLPTQRLSPVDYMTQGGTPTLSGAPHVAYRVYRSTWLSWEELFNSAAEFATQLGPQRLITISHSADQSNGVVTVWYWSDGTDITPR